MNKNIYKNRVKISLIIASIVTVLLAEDFLAPQPSSTHNKKQFAYQIKQEIAQALADIVQQESKAIELQAQMQQKLYNYINQLIENNKNSFFTKASKKDLQECLHSLQTIKVNNNKELKRLEQDKACIARYCESL